ncbi:MAG: response regulator [Actinomycetota bacterium]|nr:response regulator [Actinomycetota bacterium]
MRQAIVVDDSRVMRRILCKILDELGYEVAEAGDGQEALDSLDRLSDLSLALVDWNMPIMNGIDFVKALRSERDYDLVRIVMVTSEVAVTKMMQALNAGADEFVMKPFTRDVIEEKLALVGLS